MRENLADMTTDHRHIARPPSRYGRRHYFTHVDPVRPKSSVAIAQPDAEYQTDASVQRSATFHGRTPNDNKMYVMSSKATATRTPNTDARYVIAQQTTTNCSNQEHQSEPKQDDRSAIAYSAFRKKVSQSNDAFSTVGQLADETSAFKYFTPLSGMHGQPNVAFSKSESYAEHVQPPLQHVSTVSVVNTASERTPRTQSRRHRAAHSRSQGEFASHFGNVNHKATADRSEFTGKPINGLMSQTTMDDHVSAIVNTSRERDDRLTRSPSRLAARSGNSNKLRRSETFTETPLKAYQAARKSSDDLLDLYLPVDTISLSSRRNHVQSSDRLPPDTYSNNRWRKQHGVRDGSHASLRSMRVNVPDVRQKPRETARPVTYSRSNSAATSARRCVNSRPTDTEAMYAAITSTTA